MPQQVENATIVMLDRICEDDIGRKLRIAGRMLTYDAETTLVLLHDASNALLVDASLCVNADALISVPSTKERRGRQMGHRWGLERKSYVWVVGYLERVDSELPIPMLPAYLPPPDIDPSLVVRAVIIAPVTRDFTTRRVREVLARMAEVPPCCTQCVHGGAATNNIWHEFIDAAGSDKIRSSGMPNIGPGAFRSASAVKVVATSRRGQRDKAGAPPTMGVDGARVFESVPLRKSRIAPHRTAAPMSLLNRPISSSSHCPSSMIATSISTHTDPLRPPLQPRQPLPYPPPRDLPPSLEYDVPASSTSRFPISSIRQDAPQKSSAEPPAHPPQPVYPRHDPLHILSQTSPPPPRSYPSVLPAPSVAPGVLADGVLTAKLPSVRHFLEAATIAPPECPPLPTDNRILALVALSVFYHPLHPAHWAFWNREQKKATALMIQSVLDITPTPILSPIGWIDVPENLWILKSMQLAYAPALASIPWYATYTPAEPENRMNLRKRKPLAILSSAINGASGDETVDEEERVTPPPRKRPRTRKSAASRSAEARAKSNANDDLPDEDAKQRDGLTVPEPVQAALLLAPDDPPVVTKSAKRERIDSPEIGISTSAVNDPVQPDALDIEEAPELRKSLRQQERRAKAAGSASPASVASTLTPSVRTRGLSQAATPSRQSSSATPESVGGGESGSSTAVSLCEEDATKSKAAETVEEIADEEAEADCEEGPAAKRARTARSRTKGGPRARTTTKNKTDIVTDETKTNATVQARPKARSRARARRR
ncbi:hypothetical protein HD554DRAFT_2015619 [Boletus coccyginus]|nr:hypothetical protein HD554DRAFT_2015619 [Boletus coccyginus]